MLLDSRNKMPIYQQIKNNIIEQIQKGILLPNEQLLPVRTLARDLGINPNTVQRAYAELESTGTIYQISGKGSFVSSENNISEQLIYEGKEKFKTEVLKAINIGIKKDDLINLVTNIYEGKGNGIL